MKPLVVIAGPTASGKTALAIRLAECFDGEIVSADSMQIYRTLSIGTAKPTAEEQARVRHHMIDVAEPDASFSVVEYCAMAKKAIAEIYERGRLPFVVGGTGLYLDALVYDTSFSETGKNEALRAALENEAEKDGAEALHAHLARLDPIAAETIHKNNVKRVIRAIEIIETTKKPLAEAIYREKTASPYRLLYLVLSPPREELYRRIDVRCDKMIEKGLLSEAAWLYSHVTNGDATSLQAIGYKEFKDVLSGTKELSSAIAEFKQHTRHYAKRQLTWFKRNTDAVFLESDEESAFNEAKKRIEEIV